VDIKIAPSNSSGRAQKSSERKNLVEFVKSEINRVKKIEK